MLYSSTDLTKNAKTNADIKCDFVQHYRLLAWWRFFQICCSVGKLGFSKGF